MRLAWLLCAFLLPAWAGDPAELLSALLRFDTSNPPGNEARVANFLKTKFEPLGFAVEIIPAPVEGKAHFLARLRGNGTKRPVLIAAHADVVGVEREKWSLDPFAGVVKDGYVFGRGAIDFKGGLAVFAEAVMRLARDKVPLERDVIFLSEADEEGGDYSTRWLAREHWPKIDCEFALNEGGWIMKGAGGKVSYVSISTADKLSYAVRLTARGTSTHSSMPRPDNAIFALSEAMARLAHFELPLHLTPATRQFFLTLAKTGEGPMTALYRTLATGSDPERLRRAGTEVARDPLLNAVMRDTMAAVMMNAGFRVNVIPGSAAATLNFRLIPGSDPAEIVAAVRRVVADPRIEVEGLGRAGSAPEEIASIRNARHSTTDTDLYRALEASARAVFPGVEVTPWLFQAGTDAYPWRSRGIPVYGIYPYPVDREDLSRMHGNDERVSAESLRQGVDLVYRTLVAVAATGEYRRTLP